MKNVVVNISDSPKFQPVEYKVINVSGPDWHEASAEENERGFNDLGKEGWILIISNECEQVFYRPVVKA